MNTIDITSKVVFAKQDILSFFKTPAACRHWLETAIENHLIERIRRDMYAVIDLTTGNIYANKYLIGSCISESAVISYHSALEFHGLANQVYNTIYVSDSKKFRSFEYDNIIYEHIYNSNLEGIDQINYGAILKVTNKERTIIDSIDRVKYSGGIEEVLYALDAVQNIHEHLLLKVLKQYNNFLLYQKVGYLLSIFKEDLHLTDDFFSQIQSKVGKVKRYFLTEVCMDYVYHPHLRLYAPAYERLEALLDGGGKR